MTMQTSVTPLTVPEARAILVADEALHSTYEARLAAGQTFGIEELNAWAKLVESATDRIAAYDRPRIAPTPLIAPTPYPGGNEPDFQTLFVEAVAASDARRSSPRRAKEQAVPTSILACREGSFWVVQAIEPDVASQGDSLLGALADLGRMFDLRDQLIADSAEIIVPPPRAPVEYERAIAAGDYVGVLPLGAVRVARIYIGISPFERKAS